VSEWSKESERREIFRKEKNQSEVNDSIKDEKGQLREEFSQTQIHSKQM
jgi:hypothetical protein